MKYQIEKLKWKYQFSKDIMIISGIILSVSFAVLFRLFDSNLEFTDKFVMVTLSIGVLVLLYLFFNHFIIFLNSSNKLNKEYDK